SGPAVNEQRVEADRLRRGQCSGRGGGNLVGLADNEGLEAIAWVEVRGVGVALRRERRFVEDQERRRSRGIRSGNDSHVTDHWKNGLPCERQPIAEVRADPIGHELARHDDVERAAVRIERPELGRLQPAVKGADSKVAAKSGADGVPGSFERCGDRPDWLINRIRNNPLHCTAPPSSNPPSGGKRGAWRPNRVVRSTLYFSLAPGADSRPEGRF